MSGELNTLCLKSLIVQSKCVGGAPLFRSGMNGELDSLGCDCLESSTVQGKSVGVLHSLGQICLESSILYVRYDWRAPFFWLGIGLESSVLLQYFLGSSVVKSKSVWRAQCLGFGCLESSVCWGGSILWSSLPAEVNSLDHVRL